MDIPTNNGVYTWNNRRKGFCYIVERLDNFFVKGDLSDMELALQSSIMPYAGLDHFPVRFELIELIKPKRNPFKCEKMWFMENIR